MLTEKTPVDGVVILVHGADRRRVNSEEPEFEQHLKCVLSPDLK